MPIPPRAGWAALLATALFCSCGESGGSTARAGRAAPSTPASRPRSAEPEVAELRRLLDLGQLERARPLLARWRTELGLEGELLAARAAALEDDLVLESRCIEAARALDPSDARVYATASELHAAAGRLETARLELRRGLDVAGATPELLRAQGVLYLCQPGGAARGLEFLRSARERDPALPFTDRALGQAHLLLGREALARSDGARALGHAREGLVHDPSDVDLRRFWADALGAAGDLEAATVVLEELVREGHPLQAELALTCKRAGMADLLRRRSESALEHFRRARELGLADEELGTGASLLDEAAERCIEQGIEAYAEDELARARERFERALALCPGSLSARNHLGVVLFRQREYDAAAAAWSRVLEGAAREGFELPEPVHLNLARALHRAGRLDEARAAVEGYLEREPQGRWAEESRELLGYMEE